MFSFKVELSCFTGAKTATYVRASSKEEARRAAETRVNGRSPHGWRAIAITAEYPPDNYKDLWS